MDRFGCRSRPLHESAGIPRRLGHAAARSPGSGANRFSHFRRLLGREQFLDQQETEIESRPSSARGQQPIIDDDTLVRKKFRQLVSDGKMRSVTTSVEQAGIMQHGRCRADCRNPSARVRVPQEYFAHASIGSQMLHAGTAGRKTQSKSASSPPIAACPRAG